MSAVRVQPLIRKLERGLRLTAEERSALESLPVRVQQVKTDHDIVREGDRPDACFLLLEGFAAAFKRTGTGKRQIMTFHIPGDIPDLQSLHISRLDNTVSTITPRSLRPLPSSHQCALARDAHRCRHLQGVGPQRRTT